MGYMIAAYVISIGSVAAYAGYLARERKRLRQQLDARRAD
jgi:hypothetical protein